MSGHQHPEIEALRADLAALTRRVWQLEVTAGTAQASPAPARPAAPARQPAHTPVHPTAVTPPVRRQQPRRPVERRPAFEPRVVARQLFTVRTLAWAGGVATALGIVLLYVMAASRGWITPPMRVGLGASVSLAIVAAAVELDRRGWRADAILAASGAGIAGLYATLWAAASLYHMVNAAAAAPLSALIAGLAVAVAIRIRRQPLAVFGVAGAMLAPVLVSGHVSAGGVLFACVMGAAALPLYHRLGWRWLVGVSWLIASLEAAALAARSAPHVGFGTPVVAIAAVTVLSAAMLFLVELLPETRARISSLGWAMASSMFALGLAGTFLFAGHRELDGHSLAGYTLVGVAVGWALLACVPTLVRRPHSDLTDLLAAFSLAAAATATGLLAGGPGRACAWAAESLILVAMAERISRRSGDRRLRLTIAAGVYLALATYAAVSIVYPSPYHLPHVGAGSSGGAVALVAIAVAGVVYCFGTRWIARPEGELVWAVPAAAIAYLPAWSLPADHAVVAYAALAAGVFAYRRSAHLVDCMQERTGIAIAGAWWVAGAGMALSVSAPLHQLAAPGFAGFGARAGMAGLAALIASACVGAWSVRRPERKHAEYVLLAPVATLAYVIAEALPAPQAFWVWLTVAGLIAAAVHAPGLRHRLTRPALMAASGGMLAAGLTASLAYDRSLMALVDHGRSAGWESIAIGIAASLVWASGLPSARGRTQALWIPYALSGLLACMLLPGQYALVAIALLASAVCIAAVIWPRVLRGRLDAGHVANMGIAGAVGASAVVLLGFETPRMLFAASHTPASGLAAALAATTVLFLAAAAARANAESAKIDARVLTAVAGASALWTLAAAILGLTQLPADGSVRASVQDHFQQGHTVVSISWVLIGLALVVVSTRSSRRGLQAGALALLFVALGKLFLYDLTFLTAMARAVSFIVTGTVLLVAALLLQRVRHQTAEAS